jgi:hypothetical protein
MPKQRPVQLATLAVIRRLINVQVQGTLTAVGTVSLIGTFNFSGATVIGLTVTGATLINTTLTGATIINGTSLIINAPTTFNAPVTFTQPVTVEGGTFVINANTTFTDNGPATFSGPVTINGPSLTVSSPTTFTTVPTVNGSPLAQISDIITASATITLTTHQNPWSTTQQFNMDVEYVIIANRIVVMYFPSFELAPTVQDSGAFFFIPPQLQTTNPTTLPITIRADGLQETGESTLQTNDLGFGPLGGGFPIGPNNSGWDAGTYTYLLN